MTKTKKEITQHARWRRETKKIEDGPMSENDKLLISRALDNAGLEPSGVKAIIKDIKKAGGPRNYFVAFDEDIKKMFVEQE